MTGRRSVASVRRRPASGRARTLLVGAALSAASGGPQPTDDRLPPLASAPPRVLAWDAARTLAVDTADPLAEFAAASPLLSAVSLRDGGLLVLDGDRVRRFAPDGVERWRTGTRGRGPGEFLMLASACVVAGDTLAAFDAGLRRLTLLDGDGRVIRTQDVAAYGFMPPLACRGDGTLLMVAPGGGSADGEALATLRLVGSDGVARDSLGAHPFMYGGQLATAVARAGVVWSLAPWQDVIRRWPPGDTATLFRLAAADTARADGVLIDAPGLEAAAGTPGGAGGVRPFTPFAPRFDAALPGDDGTLWVERRPPAPADSTTWYGIRADGTLAGRLTLPALPNNTLVGVRDDGVWLLRRAESDGLVSFVFVPFA